MPKKRKKTPRAETIISIANQLRQDGILNVDTLQSACLVVGIDITMDESRALVEPTISKARPFPLRPIGNRVILKPLAPRKPAGSILLPTAAAERMKPKEFQVMAVGDGLLLESGVYSPHRVNPGDIVLLGDFNGMEHYIDGELYVSCKDGDIVGIVLGG